MSIHHYIKHVDFVLRKRTHHFLVACGIAVTCLSSTFLDAKPPLVSVVYQHSSVGALHKDTRSDSQLPTAPHGQANVAKQDDASPSSQRWAQPMLRFCIAKGETILAPASTNDQMVYPPRLMVADGDGSALSSYAVKAHWPSGRIVKSDVGNKTVYEGTVYVPISVIQASGTMLKPTNITIDVEYLLCSKERCEPQKQRLVLSLFQPPIDKELTSSVNPHNAQTFSSAWGLYSMMFMAFLGGLLLNFMPCVLPVVGLKLMGLFTYSHAHIRPYIASKIAGMLTTFTLMGVSVAALRNLGIASGMGMHFQSPLFLIAMIGLLLVFTLYSIDWLVWPHRFSSSQFLEHRAQECGMNTQSINTQPRIPNKKAGFFAGCLAVLLATPCTGPFLGGATAFAMTRPWTYIVLLFISMGLGFSTLYITALYVPVGLFLPRSGYWMLYIKRFLVTCMVGGALWLLFLLSMHVNVTFLMISIGAAVLLVLGFSPLITKRWIRSLMLTPFVVVLMIFATPFKRYTLVTQERWQSINAHIANKKHDDTLPWLSFDPERIRTLVDNGHVVLLTFTASWCQLCHYNHFILERPALRTLFKQKNIILMQGDWTKGDERIAKMLHYYGRNGIPFTALFSATHPYGVILPELLTVGIVRQHVQNIS